MKIAALEDNPARAMVLERALHPGGHSVARFRCGPSLVAAIHREPYDMLLLDRDVVGTDAEKLLDWIRRTLGSGVPVMMLGASDAEHDVARCLTAGADAYVPQPARQAELLARIEALGRRAAASVGLTVTVPPGPPRLEAEAELSDPLVCGAFRFLVGQREVHVHGERVTLSPKEYALALLLFRHLGALVSRQMMIEQVWHNPGMQEQARTIDSHLSRVRTKLRLWPFNGVMLRTVYRLGSRIDYV
ncbi:response regulator transcription factor [Cupriavidus agavae]|uniref:DNA-binding response OmpR family regulator n=1 Tax=Cupriavidus agavae TaxID=1001822 RepID=A0A4Q7RX57_9BURK|nr:response regulator transcription factor [Cupriavidus agavae]RZT38485.1 DNA-binding response OmpR family regulator [Cupriavidus agavae]